MNDDPSHLFTLLVRVTDPHDGYSFIRINAFDALRPSMGPNHNAIEVEVCHKGKVIFPRGQLHCGLPANHATDGKHAKELVMSLVAMAPGDTDPDYFANYTTAQLCWVNRYAEHIGMVREDRFCDETGEVRE